MHITTSNSETNTYVQNSVNPAVVNYNSEVASLKLRLESLEDDFTKLTAFVNTLADRLK